MQEIFKVIEGYEDLYEVSNLGNVRSIDRWVDARNGSKQFRKGRLLKPAPNNKGYLQVNLSKDGKVKKHTIHRLVAEAFISNPEKLPEVNHKDENPSNNRVENLEWCDRKYNNTYGTRTEKQTEKLINRNDLSKRVQAFNKDGELVFEFPSTREASRNGFNHGNISSCCLGKIKTAYGLIWKFA